MSRKISKTRKKRRQNYETLNFYRRYLKISFTVFAIIIVSYIVVNTFFSTQKNLSRGCRYAVEVLEKEMKAFDKKQGYIFAKNSGDNPFCYSTGSKYSRFDIKCYNTDSRKLIKNFTFDGTKIAIYGLEKPIISSGKKDDNEMYKDIIIDINGDSYPNKIGIDRVPVRLYSDGIYKGKILPINCDKDVQTAYGYKTSSLCKDSDINFLEEKSPFGYDVMYYGNVEAKNAKRAVMAKNVPFLWADCKATNGKFFAGANYCSDKNVLWMYKCHEKDSCEFTLSKRY